jgi:hypothetical protein
VRGRRAARIIGDIPHSTLIPGGGAGPGLVRDHAVEKASSDLPTGWFVIG